MSALWARWPVALGAIALACIAAVIAALAAQHAFDMRPCPWCILQRFIFLVVALVCSVGALVPSAALRRAAAALTVLLAGCGIASAIWQNAVAAKSFSCNLTFADTVISALGLESLSPALFQVTASCAEAAVSLLGIPFEFWSLALFALIGVLAAWLAVRPPVR
jgi:disulfide bond formation protein DsbB